MTKLAALIALAASLAAPSLARAADQPIAIVAAENFYGDVARQIGGPDVTVHQHPQQPRPGPASVRGRAPRSAATSRPRASSSTTASTTTRGWRSCSAPPSSADRRTIVVADLVGRKTGDNPHIWYDPATMLALAKALSDSADRRRSRPPGRTTSSAWRRFEASMQPIQAKIAELHAPPDRHAGHRDRAGVRLHVRRARHAGAQHALPARGDEQYRAERFRRRRLRERPQDPPGQAAGLQQPGLGPDRRAHGEARQRRRTSRSSGATETEPPGKTYQAWMLSELDAVDDALPKLAAVNAIEFRDVRLALGGRTMLAGVSLRDRRRASSSACSDRTAPARRR